MLRRVGPCSDPPSRTTPLPPPPPHPPPHGPSIACRTSSGPEDVEDATTPTSLHRRLLAPHRHSLVDTPLGGMQLGPAAARRRPHLTVEFRDLGLRLRSCGKVVLRGVYGQLRATRTTAIMGPSGAGAFGWCCMGGRRGGLSPRQLPLLPPYYSDPSRLPPL